MTTPPAEAENIRSYLVTQANKLSLPELVEKVRRDALPLADVAAAIPSARLREEPAPGEWSAGQVWDHILAVNERGAAAIEGIIATGAAPPTDAAGMDGFADAECASGEAYYQALLGRREALLERVLRARGDEHLDVKIVHPWFGDLNWREWLLFMRIHDIDHLRQLQRIAEQLSETA